MNPLHAHLALEAATQRRAVPRATRRHVHIAKRPLVLTGYHLAGDIGAPLAIMWGTDPDAEPSCMIVPEPRKRQLRFEKLAEFAQALVDYIEAPSNTGIGGRCDEQWVPQIVVPNPATAQWLFGTVGRFTRSLKTDGPAPAPEIVPRAGKHLSFFSDPLPGSSLVLVATQALAMHWQTGQLPAEDMNLGAVLGWISPDPGRDGPESALIGERRPPAGPQSEPNWDADVLSPLIRDWNRADRASSRKKSAAIAREMEDEIRDQLLPGWRDCWRAYKLLHALPEAPSSADRWERDQDAWEHHREAVEEDRARFRNIPTPIQSARRLRVVEDATDELTRRMALDDPLIMASHIASGEAMVASVAAVDATRRVLNRNGNTVRRPLITLSPELPFSRPVGTTMYLAAAPSVELEVLFVGAEQVQVQVVAGAVSPQKFSLLPSPAEVVILSPFKAKKFFPRAEIDEIPWTHLVDQPDGGVPV